MMELREACGRDLMEIRLHGDSRIPRVAGSGSFTEISKESVFNINYRTLFLGALTWKSNSALTREKTTDKDDVIE